MSKLPEFDLKIKELGSSDYFILDLRGSLQKWGKQEPKFEFLNEHS